MNHQPHPHSINARIGNRLRQVRLQRDLSVGELAYLSGTTPARIRDFESDEDVITAEELVLFSDALHVPLEFFVHSVPLLDWDGEWQLLNTFRQLPQQQQRSLLAFMRALAATLTVTTRPTLL